MSEKEHQQLLEEYSKQLEEAKNTIFRDFNLGNKYGYSFINLLDNQWGNIAQEWKYNKQNVENNHNYNDFFSKHSTNGEHLYKMIDVCLYVITRKIEFWKNLPAFTKFYFGSKKEWPYDFFPYITTYLTEGLNNANKKFIETHLQTYLNNIYVSQHSGKLLSGVSLKINGKN